jgi:hypothetical protein
LADWLTSLLGADKPFVAQEASKNRFFHSMWTLNVKIEEIENDYMERQLLESLALFFYSCGYFQMFELIGTIYHMRTTVFFQSQSSFFWLIFYE